MSSALIKTGISDQQLIFRSSLRSNRSVTAIVIVMFSRGPKYFDCVDLHCGGEPARVVFGTDLPTLDGVSMAEKRDNFMRYHQHVADLLLKVF